MSYWDTGSWSSAIKKLTVPLLSFAGADWFHVRTTLDSIEPPSLNEGLDASSQPMPSGQTVWACELDGMAVGISWTWVQLSPAVVAIADPMAIHSNARLVDHCGQSVSRIALLLQLNSTVHDLPWQARVLQAILRQPAVEIGREHVNAVRRVSAARALVVSRKMTCSVPVERPSGDAERPLQGSPLIVPQDIGCTSMPADSSPHASSSMPSKSRWTSRPMIHQIHDPDGYQMASADEHRSPIRHPGFLSSRRRLAVSA